MELEMTDFDLHVLKFLCIFLFLIIPAIYSSIMINYFLIRFVEGIYDFQDDGGMLYYYIYELPFITQLIIQC